MAKKKNKTKSPSEVAKKAIAAETKKEEAAKIAAEEVAAKAKKEKADAKAKEEEAAKAKQEETAKKEAATKRTTVTAPPIKIEAVKKLEIMLANYKRLSTVKVGTAATRGQAIDQLVTIMRSIVATPNAELLDVLYKFFVQERNGIMHESAIFETSTKLNGTTRTKVELLYGALVITQSNKTAKRKVALNHGMINKVLGGDVSSFFIAKNK